MVSRNRKIARRIGQAVANDVLDISGAISAGAGVTVYATADDLPTTGLTAGDEAFVSGSNRLYISNGTGWYSIGLVNTNPAITSVEDPSSNTTPFTLATDGSALVLTITAADPEDIPLTYSYAVTTGSLTNGGGTTATVVQGTGANTNQFTITPTTTEAYAGTFELTFTASDGINQGTSANSFTLEFITIITDSRYTTLLATAVDTSDNNNITDASSNNHTITVNGDTQAGTFSPYRSGGYSTSFDGTGNTWYKFPTSTDFWLTDQSFHISFWCYPKELGDYDTIITQMGTMAIELLSGSMRMWLGTGTNGTWNLLNGAQISNTLNVNEWAYITVVRDTDNNTLKSYHNGTLVYNNTSFTGTVGDSTNSMDIGKYNNSNVNSWNGYIRDLRYRVGTGSEDTSNTVPTEPITSEDSLTKLLTCHSPIISDGSSSARTPEGKMVGGSMTAGWKVTEPFSPYDYEEYDAADHGGSVYFDTSDDYLTVPNGSWKTYGSSNFTIECWFYADRDGMLWGDSSTSGVGDNCTVIAELKNFNSVNAWVQVEFRVGSTKYGINPAQGTFKRNAWNHIAFVRNGNTFTVYSNGKDVGNTSQSGSMNTSSNDWAIASLWPATTGTQFNGYISDFRVSKSARYTAEFTPPTAPLSSTGAELHLKGTDASIIDKSQGANLKLVGNTTGSTTQVKFTGSKSMYFDGTGDYITNLPDDLFAFGYDPYTVEFWIYTASYPVYSSRYHIFGSSTSAGNKYAVKLGGGQIDSGNSDGDTNTMGSTCYANMPTAGNWVHVAFVRTGIYSNQCKCYINGSQGGQETDNTEWGTATDNTIGATASGNYGFNGYIQDLRVTKGLARYTANFTPPTASLEG